MNSKIYSLPQDCESRSQDVRLKIFYEDCFRQDYSIVQDLKKDSDRYTDFKEIASGGMKTIYSVLDNSTGAFVAMAQLNDNEDGELCESFLREARLTAHLDHPNIIKVHDIGILQGNLPYFTMDLKSGVSLKEVLRKDELSLDQLLIIFAKICDGVSYAHSKGILHLDLKPDNIQIGAFGEVIICDWGLSKVFDENLFSCSRLTGKDLLNDITFHGEVKGTPGYMAPEQILSQEKNERTDIFSLGAILYQMVTGKIPFTGSVNDILISTVSTDFDRPGDVRQGVPLSLEAVVLKCLSKDAELRYGSAVNLKEEIQAYQTGYATKAENAGFIKQFQLLVKRNRKASLTIFLSFLILIFSTIHFVNGLRKERHLAFTERDKANRFFLEAKKSNDQIIKEKNIQSELIDRHAGMVVQNSVFLTENINFWDVQNSKIYEKNLSHLNRVYSLSEEKNIIAAQRAFLLLIMQRYEECIDDFELIGNKDFAELCNRIVADIGQCRPISADDLCKVINLVNGLNIRRSQRKSLIDKMVDFDLVAHSRSKEDLVKINKSLIQVWNPRWKGTIKYIAEEDKLILTGENLKKLRATQNESVNPRCILRVVNPSSLQFKNTGFRFIPGISDLKLRELDISGTKVKGLRSIQTFEELKTLSRLIIRTDQKKALRHLPKWVKVTEIEL